MRLRIFRLDIDMLKVRVDSFFLLPLLCVADRVYSGVLLMGMDIALVKLSGLLALSQALLTTLQKLEFDELLKGQHAVLIPSRVPSICLRS